MADKVSVAGIALDNGRVFIARRGGEGDMAGKWEFPGGKAEEGETDSAALIREFDEELGVPIKYVAFLGETFFEHNGVRRTLRGYVIRFISEKFSMKEHTEWRWASPEEIRHLDFCDSDLRLLPFLEKYLARRAKTGT